ncbi:MAG: hypothetical protein SGARI_005496, partial [Bacillariaceae sp.]
MFVRISSILLIGVAALLPPASAFTPASHNNAAASSSSITCLHMATWSDSKAVKDYQDFLDSGEQEIILKEDGPSVVL